MHHRYYGCIDLVAAEAVYHDNCFSRFMLNKELGRTTATKTVQGRPKDQGMLQSFEKLCLWLDTEADAELYTLSELHTKMEEFSDQFGVYSIKRLKQKLQEHYKEFLFFAEIQGRGNVVCFKNMASFIINEKWYLDKKDDIQAEAERIVIAAAKIIRAQIREQEHDSKCYPTDEDIGNNDQSNRWVPQHLQTFLKTIIPSKLKQNSIGHAIVQSARPRSVITPILFGLGIEMDHVFGSKWLINELARLGFSISYDEVMRYKQSVIQNESMENILADYIPGTFTQWVADNIDHNIATLDGQGTFHGMGIIAVSNPKDNKSITTKSPMIIRQQRIKVDELVKDKGVSIFQYVSPRENSLASIMYKPILQIQFPYSLPADQCSDLLWHFGWISSETARPNWSGFMQHIYCDDQNVRSKSEVLLLPIIDLNPSDVT